MTAIGSIDPGATTAQQAMAPSLLQVEGLATQIESRGRMLRAVDTVSFDIRHGEILGLVGESGCGKSMTALSIMRLLPPAPRARSASTGGN
jgi:ABC-type dipeptide/oligopeptide/nickel transport system ATPase component